MRVEIGAVEGKFRGALRKRAWILRIHPPVDWPKNLAPADVTVNGKLINASIHLLKHEAAAMPFGDPSGAPDSDVFEVALPAAPVTRGQSVEISFAPPNH